MNSKENKEAVEAGEVNTDNFNNLYEEAIFKLIDTLLLPNETTESDRLLPNKLKKKRQLGNEKYLGASFQFNIHNALNSPTIEHAMDELIDCMNYILHEILMKAHFLYPEFIGELRTCFINVWGVYDSLYLINKTLKAKTVKSNG